MTPPPSSAKCLAVLALLTLAACGAGDPSAPARAPSSTERYPPVDSDARPEPRTVQEAQDRIARARADLDLGARTPAADGPKTAGAAPPPPSAPPDGKATREERPEGACGGPCRALSSMRRAVEALCRMTGDGDDRCVDAKRTLTESTLRVSSCKCEGR